jgi:hypothetical protein
VVWRIGRIKNARLYFGGRREMERSPDICLNFKGEVLRDSPRLVDGQQQPQFATVIQPSKRNLQN